MIRVIALLLFCCLPTSLFAAAYSLPSHLINMPIVSDFKMGELEYGMSTGFFNSELYEFDAIVKYAITNRAQVAINYVSEATFVGHFHYNIMNDTHSPYGLAGGFANISNKASISSWDDYPVTQKNNWSPYLVGMYKAPVADFFVGFGGGRFQSASDDDATIRLLKGLMFGAELPFYSGKLALEYDGKDFNMGLRLPVSLHTSIYVGATELGNFGSTNPKYGELSPVRYFSFAATHKFNVFKTQLPEQEKVEEVVLKADDISKDLERFKAKFDEEIAGLRQERTDLVKELTQLRAYLKDDVKFIDEQDKQNKYYMRQRYLSKDQDISEKVLYYYYQALEHVSRHEHYKAIAVLQKAIILNPYLPQLYTRLGSIYYDLDLRSMAVMQWEKALELEPDNLQLQRFVEKNATYKE